MLRFQPGLNTFHLKRCSHHHFSRQKTPFLGEGQLVFMSGGPDGTVGSEERVQLPPGSPNLVAKPEQAQTLGLDNLRRALAKLDSTRTRDTSPASFGREQFDEITKELNFVSSFVENLTRMQNTLKVQQNLDDPKWARWAGEFHGELKAMQAALAENNTLKALITDKSLKEWEKQKAEPKLAEIAELLHKMETGFRLERKRMLELARERVLENVVERLDTLEGLWEKEAPEGYQSDEIVDHWVDTMQRYRAHFESTLPKLPTLNGQLLSPEEEQKALQSALDKVAQLEHHYIRAREDGQVLEGDETLEGKLERRLAEVVALKEDQIDKREAEMKKKMGATIERLKKTRTRLQKHPDLQGDPSQIGSYAHQAAERIESISSLISQLEAVRGDKNKSMGARFDEWLDSEDPLEPDEPSKKSELNLTPLEQVLARKKGFRHQMEVLKMIADPESKKTIAMGLHNALGDFEKEIENTVRVVDEELDQIVEQLDLLEGDLKSVQLKKPEAKWQFKTWVSPYTLFSTLPKQTIDHLKEAIERRESENLGKVGDKLFDTFSDSKLPVPGIKTLSNKFLRKDIQAIQDAVKDLQDFLENKYDSYKIRAVMLKTNDVREFRAAINIMSKRGMLKWGDTQLWKQFNKFQSRVSFNVDNPSRELGNIGVFKGKLYELCGTLWSYDVYGNLMGENESAFKNSVNNYANKMKDEAGLEGGSTAKSLLQSYMIDKFYKRIDGGQSYVDAAEYYNWVSFGIKQGILTNNQALYYLIQGIAHGVFSPERGLGLAVDLMGVCPDMEAFAAMKPTLAQFQDWAKRDGPVFREGTKVLDLEKSKYEPGQKFDMLVQTVLRPQQRVRTRIQTVILNPSAQIDPDVIIDYTPYVPPASAAQLLSKGMGREILNIKAAQGTVAAFEKHIVYKALNLNQEGAKADLINMLGAFVIYEGTLRGDANATGGGPAGFLTLGTDSWDRTTSANKKFGNLFDSDTQNSESMSTREFANNVKGYLNVLCPELMDFINSPSRTHVDRGFVNEMRSQYGGDVFGANKSLPTQRAELFNRAPDIIRYIIENKPDRFNAMIAFIEQSHQGAIGRLEAMGYREGGAGRQ